MSISQLLQPNNFNLFGKSLNGITTEEISVTNENGQVLTIVDKDDKIVAFVDPPSSVPDTTGFPNGYVLKITDFTQNEVNWEPDVGGGAAVPFILTGNNVNALKVQDNSLNSVFSVDTNNKQIGLNISEGLKRGYIKFLDTPEEIYTGINSSTYMTLDSDVGGAGNANFVGYVAKNGENSVIAAVNNATSGLFFNTTTNSGITTTSENFNIASLNTSGALSVQFNTEISLESNGCTLNINGNSGIIKADKKFVIQDSSTNNLEQFVVKDIDSNDIFVVDTVNDSVFIKGNDNSGAKLCVQDPLGNFIFLVDTNNDLLRMGSSAVNQTEIIINPEEGIIDIVAYGSAFFNTKIRCQHNIWNPLGGSLTMIAHRDNTDFNKLESIGASGLTISSDSNINMIGTNINITSTNPVEFFTSCPKTTNAPTLDDSLTNKRYVDNKVGGVSSGLNDSAIATGALINIGVDQNISPTLFLPSSPFVSPNYFKPGQSFELIMSGDCNFTNNDTFQIKLNAGLITLGSISITTPTTGASFWELEADFTIRSVVGVSCTILTSFDFTFNDGASFIGKRSLTTAIINPTISQTLIPYINFSVANIGSNIRTQLFILKKLVDV